MTRLVLGTRGSRLALAQAHGVADALTRACGVEVRLQTISTEGDRVQSTDPTALPSWGLGVFVRDVEAALLRGAIDFAVHSLKDLTVELPPGLILAAVPRRADPGDVLVTRDGRGLDALPTGAHVGTSSLRRAAFLRAHRPDLVIAPVRGNVDTRWRKLLDPAGGYDALVLAAAGLERLGLTDARRQPIPVDVVPPAPGQGALGLEARAGDRATLRILAALDHPPAAAAVRAERQVLRDLGGGCRLPVAALGTLRPDGDLLLVGAVASPDGTRVVRAEASGEPHEPESLGTLVATQLRHAGADDLLRRASQDETAPPAEAIA